MHCASHVLKPGSTRRPGDLRRQAFWCCRAWASFKSVSAVREFTKLCSWVPANIKTKNKKSDLAVIYALTRVFALWHRHARPISSPTAAVRREIKTHVGLYPPGLPGTLLEFVPGFLQMLTNSKWRPKWGIWLFLKGFHLQMGLIFKLEHFFVFHADQCENTYKMRYQPSLWDEIDFFTTNSRSKNRVRAENEICR